MNDHFSLTPQTEDEKFMLEALKEARKAFRAGEVPIGAVMVYDGRVIARGHNQVELLKDATAHAEMLCLTSGSSALHNWRLTNATLYCTVEPCSMCAGALLLSRVSTLVWGAPDVRHGAHGSWVNLLDHPHPFHTIKVRKGVFEEQAASLLKQFFQEQRKKVKGSPGF